MAHRKPSAAGTLDCWADPDALLRESEAAAFLGFTPRALQAWRHQGGGPPFVRVSSRAIRYRRRELIEWASKRLKKPTTNAAVKKRTSRINKISYLIK